MPGLLSVGGREVTTQEQRVEDAIDDLLFTGRTQTRVEIEDVETLVAAYRKACADLADAQMKIAELEDDAADAAWLNSTSEV
jgi:hypothetical protein